MSFMYIDARAENRVTHNNFEVRLRLHGFISSLYNVVRWVARFEMKKRVVSFERSTMKSSFVINEVAISPRRKCF